MRSFWTVGSCGFGASGLAGVRSGLVTVRGYPEPPVRPDARDAWNSGSVTSPLLESRGKRVFVLVCIVLLALNLRASVGSVGVVLTDLRTDLGMSATVAGVLTTLPVLCFAVVGSFANTFVRALGLHTTVVVALAAATIGQVGRLLTDSPAVFLLASTVALAGCAVGNVVLPPLVKLHFPDKIAAVSAVYGAAIMAGAAASAALTVPIAQAYDDWHVGLVTWAVFSFVTLLPWLRLLRHDGHATERAPAIKIGALVRTPLAWVMALFFGAQSAQAYAQFGWLPAMFHDAGLSEGAAGAIQSIVPGIGIPTTLALPYLIARFGSKPVLPWIFTAVTVAGWLGVLLSPTSAPWLWAALLGLGGTAFTWVLTMVAKRARTHEGTAALSGFVQGTGYLIASIGPFGAGALHDATGDWDAAIWGLIGLAFLLGILGTYVARPHMLEDQLAER
jgi:CP family cyanate transporter-like MFS transporter